MTISLMNVSYWILPCLDYILRQKILCIRICQHVNLVVHEFVGLGVFLVCIDFFNCLIICILFGSWDFLFFMWIWADLICMWLDFMNEFLSMKAWLQWESTYLSLKLVGRNGMWVRFLILGMMFLWVFWTGDATFTEFIAVWLSIMWIK